MGAPCRRGCTSRGDAQLHPAGVAARLSPGGGHTQKALRGCTAQDAGIGAPRLPAQHPPASAPSLHRPCTAHASGRCRPVPTGRGRGFSGPARRSPSPSPRTPATPPAASSLRPAEGPAWAREEKLPAGGADVRAEGFI